MRVEARPAVFAGDLTVEGNVAAADEFLRCLTLVADPGIEDAATPAAEVVSG